MEKKEFISQHVHKINTTIELNKLKIRNCQQEIKDRQKIVANLKAENNELRKKRKEIMFSGFSKENQCMHATPKP